MHLTKEEIKEADRVWRLNLINSISGVKPANLIGSKSDKGEPNLAIFSSVVHLGSNPAQFGFVLRPQGEVPRHTFENILENASYSINHIHADFIKNAHYTSAKVPRSVSEFNRMNLSEEYIDGFYAPFVKESKVKLGMKYLQSITLPNNCTFVIGEVIHLMVEDQYVNELGRLKLDALNNVGIGGLNTYYSLNELAAYPYVREDEIPEFK